MNIRVGAIFLLSILLTLSNAFAQTETNMRNTDRKDCLTGWHNNFSVTETVATWTGACTNGFTNGYGSLVVDLRGQGGITSIETTGEMVNGNFEGAVTQRYERTTRSDSDLEQFLGVMKRGLWYGKLSAFSKSGVEQSSWMFQGRRLNESEFNQVAQGNSNSIAQQVAGVNASTPTRLKQKYSPTLLNDFNSRVVESADIIDFTSDLSVIVSCSTKHRYMRISAMGQIKDIQLDTSPQFGDRSTCRGLSLSPDGSVLVVRVGVLDLRVPDAVFIYRNTLTESSTNANAITAERIGRLNGVQAWAISSDSKRIAIIYEKPQYGGTSQSVAILNTDSKQFERRLNYTFLSNHPRSSYEDLKQIFFTDPSGNSGAVMSHYNDDRFWESYEVSSPLFTPISFKAERIKIRWKNGGEGEMSYDYQNVGAGSVNGKWLASSLKRSQSILLFDPKSKATTQLDDGGQADEPFLVKDVAFSIDEKYVASCAESTQRNAASVRLMLWSIDSKRVVSRTTLPQGDCPYWYFGTKMRLSPNAEHVWLPDHDWLKSGRSGSGKWVKWPGFLGADADKWANVVESGSPDDIKKAFDNARSPDEKRALESALVQKHLNKLLTVKYTVRGGSRSEAFGGVGQSDISKALIGITGYRMGTEATTDIDFQLQLDPKLMKINNRYDIEADVTLIAKGDGYYENHCAWPLPTVCKNKETEKTYSTVMRSSVSGNDLTRGIASIKWTPKFERRAPLSGLTQVFVTENISLNISNVKISLKD